MSSRSFVLFGVGSNAERHTAISMLVDGEPREVLLVDHEASVRRMSIVGDYFGERQTDRRHAVEQNRLLHGYIFVHFGVRYAPIARLIHSQRGTAFW